MYPTVQFLLYYSSLIFAVILLGIYLFFKRSYTFWKRRDVPFIEPTFPLGNNDLPGAISFNYGIETSDWYFELKRRGLKLGGAWCWAKPVLVVTDLDYIKDILVKDFNIFVNRDFYSNPQHDPANEGLFVAKNDEWKTTRQNLSPAFTTAKMKLMFDSINDCAKLLINNLNKYADNQTDIDIELNLGYFTIDVIGRVIFGLNFKCLSDENSEFRQFAKFKPKPPEVFRAMMTRLSENFAKKLGISLVPVRVTDFFTKITKDNIQYRKSNDIHERDFTQTLMDFEQSSKGQAIGFDFDRLVANKIIFFNAGSGTSSATMKFTLYELTKQPIYQDRVRQEIQQVLKKYNGELTYEGLQEMTYLKQIVDETLRMYPPLLVLSRIANKSYRFANSNITIPKGTTVIIPPIAIGRDPEFYPEPEKFDPERFNNENKSKRNPYIYLPFGIGPRNCIGKRIGLIQVLAGLALILSEFKFSLSSSANAKLKRGSFLVEFDETLYLKASRV